MLQAAKPPTTLSLYCSVGRRPTYFEVSGNSWVHPQQMILSHTHILRGSRLELFPTYLA